MSKDEIIAMARESGCVSAEFWPGDFAGLMGVFERFAALVEAKKRDDEREACAQVCEDLSHRSRWVRAGINGVPMGPCQYAAAIRARSNHVA